MAPRSTPHFHNDMGARAIEVGTRDFMCVGATPPFDHPHVFLDMGTADEIVCPYCSTLYVHNAELGADEARPAEAVWHGQAA